MDERRRDQGLDMPEPTHTTVVRRRPFGRVASLVGLGLLVLLIAIIAIVWIERRPIAVHYLKGEFERRGVTASYHLVRVGLRTQEVTNLIIGDPGHPDLIARYAHIETRLKWNGEFNVYRIVARGVRLRGRLVHGRVSWGQIDQLLPPPTNKPFALPDFVVDIADSSVSLATPFGPLGLAVQGNGKLSGGFAGNAAVVSPRLVPGRCAATNLRATVAIGVTARHPHVEGPVTLDQFACPLSRFLVQGPRFDAKASFNEAFTNVDGSGRMAIASLVAGANGLANFAGAITYKGVLNHVDGRVTLSAQKSRMATIYADRTHLNGGYHLGIRDGTFNLVGDYAADSGRLDPRMIAGVTQPLAAAAKTPIGPVVSGIGNAISRTAGSFNSAGRLTVVNFPGGGAARVTEANIVGPAGARARLFGGSGVTYYWPSAGLRIDSTIEMAGGGLPQGRITLRQPNPNSPMSGIADLAPYTATNGQRLALAPIRFGPGPGGSTALSTTAQLDGPFPNGRVQALRLPITGEIGSAGSFAFGTSCAVVSFNYLKMSTLQLGPTRLPVCPIGPAIIAKRPGGPVLAGASLTGPVLNGSIGSSPLHVQAAHGQIIGQQFAFSGLGARFGRPSSPLVFDASRLTGTFASYLHGNFAGAAGSIGKVPLQLSDASGDWRYRDRDLTVSGALTVSDRAANPRFYPLRSDNVRFSLVGDMLRASGALRHPATGTLVTNVDIEHRLSTGVGHASLDVPGLTFGENLQPAEITRLTEGVIALVQGTIRGQGQIDWSAGGKVTSSGDFSTANLDLAAPFGPLTGLSGTVHFNDLLGLTTPPGQVLTAKSINPGILVENGVIRYQLLPHQLVKIERGEWPFMGGRLILQETVLNFGHPSAKRLTFEVVGLDAHTFVQTLGFKELDATGVFDGVLPMIFDESGGRIVGGRLDSRPGGGSLAYNGVVNKADLGTMGNIAFNALRDLRFRSMIIRLDGDLAGEFTSRLAIDGVGLGQTTTQKIIRSLLSKIPLKLNVTISGPFRALIATAKSFNDPRTMIGDVLPHPLQDVPGITTEVRRVEENQQQTQTPVTQKVNTTPPPSPTKR
jgi:translocation and assembly module TamB